MSLVGFYAPATRLLVSDILPVGKRGMNPQTFQQRTDDLYRLQTRDLIYRNVNGSYPTKGSVGYIANTVGTVGWSPVTTDSSGNLTAPGTVSLGLNGALTVDGVTRIVRAADDMFVEGDLTALTVTTNNIGLINTNNVTQTSDLYVQNDVSGIETLTWANSQQVTEPISGWSAKLAIYPAIFRTVPITPDLSGSLLILAENMNNLLQCLKTRGCFVETLTPVGEVATVFNTNAAVQITMTDGNTGNSTSFVYTRTGSSNVAVSYSQIATDLTAAAFAVDPFFLFNATYTTEPADPLQGSMSFTFGDDNNFFTIQFDDAPDVSGGGQMFLNHLGFGFLHTGEPYDNDISTSYPLVVSPLRDFVVLMPPVPTDISVQTITSTTCTINLPSLPLTTPVTIQNTCVYWCISGETFDYYLNETFVQYIPNEIIDPATTLYEITGLTSNTAYDIAISYRSLNDETLRSRVLQISTPAAGPSLMKAPTMNIYSVDITQDVNWISTPSYGTVAPNYTKPYAANVRFNVASVFAAIWTNTLNDLHQISQIQSVTLDFYAGAEEGANASFFINRTAISPDVIEADENDAVGLGGTLVIEKGDPLLSVLFAANDGVINTSQKITFGWSSDGGGIRNCEMTGFTVVYSV
jgi:hypothetical protein